MIIQILLTFVNYKIQDFCIAKAQYIPAFSPWKEGRYNAYYYYYSKALLYADRGSAFDAAKNCIQLLIGGMAGLPQNVLAITLIARDDMHMEMMDRLSCCFSVVLNQIEAVRMQLLFEHSSHCLRRLHCFRRCIRRDLKQICIVVFGKHKRMTLRSRSVIQDHSKEIILINGSAGDLAICDLTENTVVIFHHYLRISHFADSISCVLIITGLVLNFI